MYQRSLGLYAWAKIVGQVAIASLFTWGISDDSETPMDVNFKYLLIFLLVPIDLHAVGIVARTDYLG